MIQLLNRTSNNSSLLADSYVAWPYPAVPQMSRHYHDDDHARGVYRGSGALARVFIRDKPSLRLAPHTPGT